MNDRELTNLLRGLPRTSASPRFTSDVLRAVRNTAGEDAPRRPFIWRATAAFATAVCLVFVVQIALVQHAKTQRLAALRAEQTKLEAELEAVKKLADSYEPVVVLEHRDGTRVVVEQTPQAADEIVPASFTID